MEGACEAVRMGQVAEAEDSLHQCCDDLEDRITVLEERLTNILGSEERLTNIPASEPPEEQLVPLADSIRRAKKSIVRSRARINSIVRRIEL